MQCSPGENQAAEILRGKIGRPKMNRKLGATLVSLGALGLLLHNTPVALATDPARAETTTEAKISVLYKKLIDAENAHDLKTVRRMVWKSPSALFVAKTKTVAEGNWAGFWGSDTVVDHIGELFQGTFVMEPDYSREKVVRLGRDVMQTYVPLNISVGYAGQSGTPKPFLMIVEWVKDGGEWKMATDIALPIPPPPAQ
jgi:hypothetical protein